MQVMAASTSSKKPGLSMIEDEFWYVGALSERKAENVLLKRGEKGSFLVRDCLLPDADYVLSVNDGKDIDHYQIKVSPNNECILNNYTFPSLTEAVEFYSENRLGSVFLNPPEEPVVAEPVTQRKTGPQIRIASVSPAHQSTPPPTHSAQPVPQNTTPQDLQSTPSSPPPENTTSPPQNTATNSPPPSPPPESTKATPPPPQSPSTPPPQSTATPATPPPQSTSTPPPQSTATPPPQSTATPPPQSTATPPPQSTATPPPQSTTTPPPQSTATPATPPPQSTTSPPPRSTSTPPPQSTATPPPQSTATPPPQSTATPPPQSTATPPPQSTATPPPQSRAMECHAPQSPSSDIDETVSASSISENSNEQATLQEESASSKPVEDALPPEEPQQPVVCNTASRDHSQVAEGNTKQTSIASHSPSDGSSISSQTDETNTNKALPISQAAAIIEGSSKEQTNNTPLVFQPEGKVPHENQCNDSQSKEEASGTNDAVSDASHTVQINGYSASAQTAPLKSSIGIRADQQNELNSLPSIGEKRKALEQQLTGEAANDEKKEKPKKKAPPPVPKRTIFKDLSKTDEPTGYASRESPEQKKDVEVSKTDEPNDQMASTESQEREKEAYLSKTENLHAKSHIPTSDVIKASVTTTPPPTPKKLLIPQMFDKNKEDQNPLSPGSSAPKKLLIPQNFQGSSAEEKPKEKVSSPIESPKRVVIPESLQDKPLPPPLTTHPEMIKKEEERQHQLLQAEMDKQQAQKSKKRHSFFRRKNKDSDKDKSSEKRKSNLKEEPITLEEAVLQKQKEQKEQAPNPSPPRPKKVIGVPTLGMSPEHLEASGGSNELKQRLQNIRKQEGKEKQQREEQLMFGKVPIKLSSTPVGTVQPESNQTLKGNVAKQESSGNIATSTRKQEDRVDGEVAFSTFGKPSPSPVHTAKASKEAKPRGETSQAKVDEEVSVSTFGQPVVKVSQSAERKVPEGTGTPKGTRTKKESIVEVSTFKPNGINKPSPEEKETSFFSSSTTEPNKQSASSLGISPNASPSPISSPQWKPQDSPSLGTLSSNSANSSPYLRASPQHSGSPSLASSFYQANATPPSPKAPGESQSVGLLPGTAGFVISQAGNPAITAAPHGINRQHQSLADVVPGIPRTGDSLKRGLTGHKSFGETDSPGLPSRSYTMPSKRPDDKKTPVAPVLINSKRTGGKKRGSIFKKK